VAGLFPAKGKAISPQAELDRIAKRRASNDFDRCSVAKSHLQEPATKFRITSNCRNIAAAPDPQDVEGAGVYRSLVFATGQITSLHPGLSMP
jgi:hypothetical protein